MSSGFELNPISSQSAFSFKQVILNSLQMDNLLQCLGQPCFLIASLFPLNISCFMTRLSVGTGSWVSEKAGAEVCASNYDNLRHRAAKARKTNQSLLPLCCLSLLLKENSWRRAPGLTRHEHFAAESVFNLAIAHIDKIIQSPFQTESKVRRCKKNSIQVI